MPKKYEKFEDLPPAIQEGLKKRGWPWPFTDEFIRERLEARKRFKPMSTPLEVQADRAREDADWVRLRLIEERIRQEKGRQQEGSNHACGTTDVS